MEWFRDAWTLLSLDVAYKADSLLSESNICHHNRWQNLVDTGLECTNSELEQTLVSMETLGLLADCCPRDFEK